MAAVIRLGAGAGGTGTTTASWTGFNFTSSGPQTVCIVLVNFSVSSNAVATCSVKYDTAGANVTMKQLGTLLGGVTTTRAGVGIYYLFNPGVGAKNITVTPAGATIASTHGIDVALSQVSTIGMPQTVATMAHTATSVANGYALRVLSNGVTTGTLSHTTELATGGVDAGLGDFIAVQSAVGAAPSVAFTASGTATTPLSIGCVVNPVGQINYLQSQSSTELTSLTQTVVLSGPSFVGDTIMAAFKTSIISTAVLTGVTDTSGNTYSVACPVNATGNRRIWVYYAPVRTATDSGTNTVTVTFTVTAPTNLELIAAEYDGLHPTNPFDQHKEGNSTTGTAMDTGATPTTTAPNELVFAYGVGAGNVSAAGAGYTGRIVGTDAAVTLIEDKIVAAIGTYNGTGTVASGAWMISCATFKQKVASNINNPLSVAVNRAASY